ncbi:MAG: hypothetical protein Q9218_001129 [Villophora microphyllina]
MVTVADELTIMIPSTETDAMKYIDIPLNHIVNILLETGGPGSQTNPSPPSSPTVLILHLLKSATKAYYINESSRPPCRINIAFDELTEAEFTKNTIEALTGRRNGTDTLRLDREAASSPGLFTGQVLSQSVVLDVSSGLREQRRSKNTQEAPWSQDEHFEHLVNTATRAQALLVHPTRQETASTGGIGAHEASWNGRPRRISESSVMMATQLLNVSQEAQAEATIEREKSKSGSMAETMSKDKAAWRAGLRNTDNIPELQSHHRDLQQPPSNGNVSKSSSSKVFNDFDDDLYSATPRAHGATGNMESKAHRGVHSLTFTSSRELQARKLSHRMRIDDTEQPSKVVSTAAEIVQASSIHKTGRTDKLVSHSKSSRGSKRKNTAIQPTAPNKKAKIKHVITEITRPKGDVGAVTPSDTGIDDEFDVPATPPDPRRAKSKLQESIHTSKISNGKAKTTKTLPKSGDTNVNPIAGKQTSKRKVKAQDVAASSGETKSNQDKEAGNVKETSEIDADFKPSGKGHKKPQPKAAYKTNNNKKIRSTIVKQKVGAKVRLPRLQEPVRRPKSTRAAAKTAKQRIKDSDEDVGVEAKPSTKSALPDSPTEIPTGQNRDPQHNGEIASVALADASENGDDPMHYQAVETNFEDAVAILLPQEEHVIQSDHSGHPADNNLGARVIREDKSTVVAVSGKGGFRAESANEMEYPDLGLGQDLPVSQGTIVLDGSYLEKVAPAGDQQQGQSSEEPSPFGHTLKRPTTPERLLEPLGDTLSSTLGAHKSMQRQSQTGGDALLATIQQSVHGSPIPNMEVVAQPAGVTHTVALPQSNHGPVHRARTVLEIPNSDPFTVTSGPSEYIEGTDVSSRHQGRVVSPQLQQSDQQRQDLAQNLRRSRTSPQSPLALDTPYRKLQSANTLHDGAPIAFKMTAKAVTPSESKISGGKAKVSKDPYRIPNMISFSAKGPRNQGIPSPAVPGNIVYSNQTRKLGESHTRKRRRDVGFALAEASNSLLTQMHEYRLSKKARIDNHLDDLPAAMFESVPPMSVATQPKHQARDVLPEHSSVFADDLGPKVSSQSSRVLESGSPLPYRHLRHDTCPGIEEDHSNEGHSDSENLPPPVDDEDYTFVQQDFHKSSEPDLPAVVLPRLTHKKEATFIRSSNSKHHPSSPNAPSAILTGFEAHEARPLEVLDNGQSHGIFGVEKSHDPFLGAKSERRNGFLERLRRAQGDETRNTEAAVRDPLPKHRHKHQEVTIAEDPDTTLVEGIKGRFTEGKRGSPMFADTTGTSSSQGQSHSSDHTDGRNAAAQRWLDALEPHQHNMLEVLCEISHNLMGHLIDAETAVEDVVNDYQRRGNRMVEKLAEDLKKGLEDYAEDAKTRHKTTAESMRMLRSKLTGNLKQKPVAEKLAKQLKERRRVTDERMEIAMRLCTQ